MSIFLGAISIDLVAVGLRLRTVGACLLAISRRLSAIGKRVLVQPAVGHDVQCVQACHLPSCSRSQHKGPDLSETTKQRMLLKAVDLVGMEELAVQLGVPVHLLDAWIRGMASMPDRKFLLLADFLDKFGRPEKG